jgi:hypothetical protein
MYRELDSASLCPVVSLLLGVVANSMTLALSGADIDTSVTSSSIESGFSDPFAGGRSSVVKPRASFAFARLAVSVLDINVARKATVNSVVVGITSRIIAVFLLIRDKYADKLKRKI